MNRRKPRRPGGSEREFALVGDLAGCDEVDLGRVLTWSSREALRQQLLAQLPMVSKQVMLAERGAPLSVGAWLPVDAEEAWLVRLGGDRGVPRLAAGMSVTFLRAEFEGAGNAQVWRLWPQVAERAQVQSTKVGLALVMLE